MNMNYTHMGVEWPGGKHISLSTLSWPEQEMRISSGTFVWSCIFDLSLGRGRDKYTATRCCKQCISKSMLLPHYAALRSYITTSVNCTVHIESTFSTVGEQKSNEKRWKTMRNNVQYITYSRNTPSISTYVSLISSWAPVLQQFPSFADISDVLR